MGYVTGKIVTATLKNGSSSNLAVNGSITPQIFTYNPGANYDMEINSVCLLAETSNSLAFGNKFIDSTIATLTNGLLIEVKSNDVSDVWHNCKRTRDILELTAPDGLEIVTGVPNVFNVHFWVPNNFRIYKQGTFSTDDYLQVTVRDDLRAISYMEIFLLGVKL